MNRKKVFALRFRRSLFAASLLLTEFRVRIEWCAEQLLSGTDQIKFKLFRAGLVLFGQL